MSQNVIEVAGVAKRYEIGASSAGYQTFREAIVQGLRLVRRNTRGDAPDGRTTQEFWALQDVSFAARQGEVLGVIGRNGAGKSTLLKVLSRITEPTRGTITIRGRVASLLEVGTGFHPELTGRENIFLNGAILGMKREEILRKFDDIVAFSEVETFLDTPVKRYSSGMYVRLAFAVAANLDPEILLVDEVLAVGDMDFQRKCLDRMKDLAKGASTIVFVSHNMQAVQALCDRCVLLDRGRVVAEGAVRDVMQRYTSHYGAKQTFTHSAPRKDKPVVLHATLTSGHGLATAGVGGVRVDVDVRSPQNLLISMGFMLKDNLGLPIAYGHLGDLQADGMVALEPGMNRVSIVFSTEQLAIGQYTLGVRLALPSAGVIEDLDDCLAFDVEAAGQVGGYGMLPQSFGVGSFHLPVRRV